MLSGSCADNNEIAPFVMWYWNHTNVYCFGLSNSEQQIIKTIRPNWVTKPIDIPVRISNYVHYTDYTFISGFIVLFFVSFSVAIVFVSFLVHFLVNEFCFTYTVIFFTFAADGVHIFVHEFCSFRPTGYDASAARIYDSLQWIFIRID